MKNAKRLLALVLVMLLALGNMGTAIAAGSEYAEADAVAAAAYEAPADPSEDTINNIADTAGEPEELSEEDDAGYTINNEAAGAQLDGEPGEPAEPAEPGEDIESTQYGVTICMSDEYSLGIPLYYQVGEGEAQTVPAEATNIDMLQSELSDIHFWITIPDYYTDIEFINEAGAAIIPNQADDIFSFDIAPTVAPYEEYIFNITAKPVDVIVSIDDNGVMTGSVMHYGETIFLPEPEDTESSVFNGWYVAPASAPDAGTVMAGGAALTLNADNWAIMKDGISIASRWVAASVSMESFTFGDEPGEPVAEAEGFDGAPVITYYNSADESVELSGLMNVGTYTVVATWTDGDDSVSASSTFTVGRKAATVTVVDPEPITCGGTLPASWVAVTEGVIDGYAIQYDLVCAADADVIGNYPITFADPADHDQPAVTLQGNYEITFVPGVMIVNPGPRPGTEDLENQTEVSIVYDGADHFIKLGNVQANDTLYYSIGGELDDAEWLAAAVDADGYLTAIPFRNVADCGSVVYLKVENPAYATAYYSFSITIQPAPLTVTTSGNTEPFVYDGITGLTVAGGSIAGLVGSDAGTVKVITTGYQREVGSSDNTYYIDWGNADSRNYTVAKEELGQLVVSPAPMTSEGITVGRREDKVYNGSEQLWAPAVKWLGVSLVEGEDYTLEYVGDTVNAGRVYVKISAVTGEGKRFTGDTGDTYYYDIAKAPLAVETLTQSFTYDDAWHTGTGTLAVNGAAAQSFSYSANGNNVEPITLPTGDQVKAWTKTSVKYPTNGAQDNAYELVFIDPAKANNYQLGVALGKLNVEPAPFKATLSIPETMVYGQVTQAEVSRDAAYGNLDVTYYEKGEGDTWSSVTVPVNAGDYKVVASWAGRYYAAGTLEQTFTIQPRPVTVTVRNATKVFGNADPTVFRSNVESFNAARGTGLVVGDSLGASRFTRAAGEDVGEYAVELALVNANANYDITIIPGKLTITPATSAESDQVVLAPVNAVYDGEAHTIEAPAAVREGDVLSYSADGETWSETIPAFVDAGAYEIAVRVTNPNFVTYEKTAAVTIAPKPVTITVDSKSVHFGDAAPELTATVTEGISPDFKLRTAYTAGSDVGSYTIEAYDVADSANFDVTIINGTLTVLPVGMDVTINGYTGVYDGRGHGISVTGQLAGSTIEYNIEGQPWTTEAPSFKDVVNATVYVRITNANYEPTSSVFPVNVVITPAPLTITTGSATKTYDGSALTAAGSIAGLVGGERVGFVVTGSQLNAGSSINAYSIAWGDVAQTNYTIREDLGTLTVNRKSVTSADIRVAFEAGANADVTYNGQTQRQAVAVTEGAATLAAGRDFTVSYGTNTTDAGLVAVTVAGAGNYDGSTTLYYNIRPAVLTVTTPSATAAYSGEALTAAGTVEGLVNGETVSFLTTGSQTELGSSQNTYELSWTGTAKAENYTVVTGSMGILTVNRRNLTDVTISAPVSVTYDAAAHRWTPALSVGGRAMIADRDYTVAYSTGDFVNAGTITVTISGIGNFTGSVQRSYTIGRATLTVTTEDADKVFDGEALTAGGTVTGLVNGETVTLTVTGTQTEIGSSENGYELTWNGTALASNYDVVAALGTLTVNEEEVETVAIEEDETPLAADPQEDDYSLTEDVVTLEEDDTPLAANPLENSNCILHFVLAALALCVVGAFIIVLVKHKKKEKELAQEIKRS